VPHGIEVNRSGRILEVCLNRPKVNAIDVKMSQELGRAFAELRDNKDLWVGILTAKGEKIFSAGWDLKALNSGEMSLENWWETSDYGDGGFAGLTENWNLNKPVIGALNGLVIGGGFELALGCDLLLAAENVEFGLPEMPLGIVPDAGALQRLPRRIPYHIAMEMLFTGRWLDSEEAARWGLINQVHKSNDLLSKARELAELLASGPPLVYAAIKEVVREAENMKFNDALNMITKSQFRTVETLYRSEDQLEGARAFSEKRDPVWRGK